MSNEEIIIGDKMIEARLKKKSNKLNISLDSLIERYIKIGLFMDDFYEPPQLTSEEVRELIRKDAERDRKRGIPPRKHNHDVFIGILNKD